MLSGNIFQRSAIIQSSLNEDFNTFSLLLSSGDFSFKQAFETQIDAALDQRVSYLPPSHQTQELMQEIFSKEFSSLAIQALTSVARKYFEDYVRKNPEDALVKEYTLLDQSSRSKPEYVSRVCQLLYAKGIFKDAVPTHEFIFENPFFLSYSIISMMFCGVCFENPGA